MRTFVCLGIILIRDGALRSLVQIAVGLLLLLAFLDMIENFHFMVMLAQAEIGLLPSSAEIGAQVLESLLKFHVSYLGLFVLGLALPLRTAAERWVAGLSLFIQLPVGILISVTPHDMSVPLVFVRFAYFVSALALVGYAFGNRCGQTRRAPCSPFNHPSRRLSGGPPRCRPPSKYSRSTAGRARRLRRCAHCLRSRGGSLPPRREHAMHVRPGKTPFTSPNPPRLRVRCPHVLRELAPRSGGR